MKIQMNTDIGQESLISIEDDTCKGYVSHTCSLRPV